MSTVIATTLPARPATAQVDLKPGLWSVDGDVRGMAIVEDTLYVAGLFDAVGPPTGMIGFFDPVSGEVDLDMPRLDGDQLNVIGIRSIEPDGQGGYYVGGLFRVVVDGMELRNLVRIGPQGSIDPTFSPNPTNGGGYPNVSALLYDPMGTSPSGAGVLYVGGQFAQVSDLAGTHARTDLAVLDASTGEVLEGQIEIERDFQHPGILTFAIADQILYIGGMFTAMDNVERRSLAAVDPVVMNLLPWDPDLERSDAAELPRVEEIVIADGTLYVAGNFQKVQGLQRDRIAEIGLAAPSDGAGGAPTDWNPQYGGSTQAFTRLLVIGDYVWASGSFIQQGTRTLARVDRQSAQMVVYPAGGGLRQGHGLAFDPSGPDGDGGPSGQGVIYLGASRQFDDNQTFPVVQAIDPATGQPTGFELMGGPKGPNRQPRVLHVEPGGRLVVGGPYYFMGGFRQNGMAAFDLTTGRPVEGFPFSGQGEALRASTDGRFLYRYSKGPYWLSLDEFDLATYTARDFTDEDPLPPPPPADWPDDVYVANARSGLEIAGDTLFVSLSGGVAMDRSDGSVIWQTPMASVGTFHLDPGTALLIPPGPDSAFGEEAPTLILSGPFEHGPVSDLQHGFFALNALTGELSDWYPMAHPLFVARGFAAEYQPAIAGRPASLWLGGKVSGNVEGQTRDHILALDPPTAALQPFDVCLGGGSALDPVHAILTIPEGTALDAHEVGGVTYVGGGFGICPQEPTEGWSVAAVDPVTGEHQSDWHPRMTGMSIGARSLLYSERHGALFVGGRFTGALGGSGRVGVMAVSPHGWQPPVTTEPGGAEQPRVATLSAPFPNPARYGATVTLTLPQAGAVEVALYDVLGRRVAVVHEGPLAAGQHALALDTSRLASGLYVVRAAGEGFAVSRRITVVR
jgi:hypothetical protein